MRPSVVAPVALVLPEDEPFSLDGANSSELRIRIDAAHVGTANLCQFHIGRNRLAVALDRDADRTAIQERLTSLGDLFDLTEPFGRIREAIEEAQRGGR